ncbi:MAG TPA: hypothetical protein VEX38_02200 [Fimbriimonadaceae bacterium]|nr:hypothetical protein [Fimbriimonadaceae bacterium]
MKIATKMTIAALGVTILPSIASAQVPDLVAAFDAGGRAMGMGGATYVTGSDTMSGYYNPAGLAYVSRGQVGLTFRNMPQSRTTVSGDLVPTGSERLSSEGDTGPRALSHVGIAIPLRNRSGSTNGTIGLALTTGGQIRDERTAGPGLAEGGLGAPGYSQLLKSKTDFVSLSYGRSLSDTFNICISLLYAVNNQSNVRNGVPSGATSFEETATGLGLLVGMQFTPRDNPNLMFGASYRTPISLKGRNGAQLIYDKIPARLQIGGAVRRDGLRGGRDFILVGADVQHFFAGNQGVLFDRDPQTVLGFGLEYSYATGSARVPIRLGYQFVPAGGNNFGARNSFTYGVGYRPGNGDWGVDVNFGRAQAGGQDMSINLMYRFGR